MSEAVANHGHADSHEHHDPNLQHHFDSMEQQFDASKIGMWIFLATEILLFGGLFCAYAIYRSLHPEIFMYASQYLDVQLGALNTGVLIFSSFTAAWAVRLAQLGKQTGLIICLILTILCGGIFMVVKYVEYKHKWEHGLLWGTHYVNQLEHGHGAEGSAPGSEDSHEGEAAHAAESDSHAEDARSQMRATTVSVEEDKDKSNIPLASSPPTGLAVHSPDDQEAEPLFKHEPSNVHKFFGVYFCMTGLHGIHVLIGMGALTWVLSLALRGKISAGYYTPVDLTALYWHIVDLIWIYLFPLLYLID